MQQRGAQEVQLADGAIQRSPDNRLGGRVFGQFVQVALNDDGGVFLTHGANPPPVDGVSAVDCTMTRCALATLSNTAKGRGRPDLANERGPRP
jgi:hypothetical protein